MRFGILCIAALSVTACVDLPEITPTRSGLAAPEGYPDLVPLAPVLAGVDASATTPEDTDLLQARAAALGQKSAGAPGGLASSRIAALRDRAHALRGDPSDLEALRAAMAKR